MGVKERHGFHMQMFNRAAMANWRYESTSGGISRTRSILVALVRVIRISAGAKFRVIDAQIDSFVPG
jgi:hypothetical protein